MKTRIFAALIVALFAVPASSPGQTQGPTATLTVGDQVIPIPVGKPPEGKQWILGYNPETGQSGWTMETSAFRATVSGVMDPDPSIGYGIAVTNFLAVPVAYGFIFATPIVPVGTPNIVTGSVVGGLTDFTGDGIAMTPTGPDLQVAEVLAPATNMGVDVGPAFSAPATGPPGGAFYPYGSFAEGPIAGPGPGPWTILRTTTSFTLSGSGDTFALTGFASINMIPEPSTVVLTALACLGILGMLRNRK
jgi:hypothetical protein